MKAKVERHEFAKYLILASHVLEAKSVVPVLGGIKLEADKEEVRISASSLKSYITLAWPAEVSEGGSVVAPGKPLVELVKTLPEGELNISATEKTCTIYYPGGRTRFHVFLEEDYPLFPAVKEEKKFLLPAGELQDVTSKVVPFCGDLVPFEGVNLKLTEGIREWVASDRHRLAYLRCSAEGEARNQEVLVPPDAIKLANRLVGPETLAVEVYLDDAHIVFKTPFCTFWARLLAGKFPDYHTAILTKNAPVEVFFDRNRMLEVLERAKAVQKNEKSPSMKLTLAPGKVMVIAEGGYGELLEQLAAETEAEGEVLYNTNYLAEALKTVSEKAVLRLAEDFLFSVFDDGDYRQAVLPLRLK